MTAINLSSDKIRNLLRMAILVLLLLIPILYAMAVAIDLEYSWLKKAAYLITVLLLLGLPALFMRARTYFLVEGVLNFLFFPIDIASLYLNRQPTSTAFLQNIYSTNYAEATELVSSMWLPSLLVIVLWVLYFWLACRVDNVRLFSWRATRIFLYCFAGLIVSGLLAMVVHIRQVHSERTVGSTLEDAAGLAWMKLYKIYPYNLYLETAELIDMHRQQTRLQQQVSSFRFGIEPVGRDEPELYILVIGEAARYDHFGMHGYERNTTPLLEQQPVISYSCAYSQANLTANSVPLIITRATADERELAYSEKSIAEAFQEAGFEAGWLTKQIPSMLIDRIMGECEYSQFYAKGIDVDNNYDEEMVATLHGMVADTLQFFVLHSLGCHFRYALRYPKEFEQFTPVLGKTFSYSMLAEENKQKIVNAYDNAILYTDYFLNALISYADSLNRPAAVLYISDHGESFWDDERKLSLHGSYQVSEPEYHVPLFVWCSEEYTARYPDKVAALNSNRHKPVSSDVVFYSLLDLAGVSALVDSTRSLCSPALLPMDTIRVITGSGQTERWGIPKPLCP